jgi:alkylhydroperoxidase/carboxymuconolactone decarboxylase family protein YurZ
MCEPLAEAWGSVSAIQGSWNLQFGTWLRKGGAEMAQLRFHLGRAVENGVKQEELIEAITHLAFYCGWPSAMTAILLAKELFGKAK